MDNTKCAQATPRGTLLEQLMNPNVAKNEREWAAVEEIDTLKDRLEVLEREHMEFYDRWHIERRKREALELEIARKAAPPIEIEKARVKYWCDLADEVTADARKAERLKRHECKACFYASRIGGSAITTRPCMSCGSDEMYCSTATDVLCMDCATKHGLCKYCGGDLEMRTRRKDWPETHNADNHLKEIEND